MPVRSVMQCVMGWPAPLPTDVFVFRSEKMWVYGADVLVTAAPVRCANRVAVVVMVGEPAIEVIWTISAVRPVPIWTYIVFVYEVPEVNVMLVAPAEMP